MSGAVFFTVLGLGSLAVAHDHADHDRTARALGWVIVGCIALLIAVTAWSVV